MKIHFICNPVFLNGGWSPLDKRIGGSEEAIVEWGKILSREHNVTVFHNGQHGKFGDVYYRDHSEYGPADITVNVNYPQFPAKGKTIFFSSLVKHPDLSQFDAVCALTEYALNNTGIVHPNTHIVPLGYDEAKIYPKDKVKKQCLYASSPDRGLDTLERIWPSVVEQHPDAHLYVTYGGQIDAPNTTCGEFSEDEMNDLFATSEFWLHPCSGGEMFCITGKKAQVAGCIPVIIPTMALAETVKIGLFAEDERDFYYKTLEALSLSEEEKSNMRNLVVKNADALTWEESTRSLLKVIEGVL